MKKFLAVFLAALLLLSGCSIVREDEPNENNEYLDEPQLMQNVNLKPSITINPVLYFLDETTSTKRLSAETRQLSVPQDQRAAMQVVQALIDGPVSETLSPVADGFELDSIQLLPDVINVYLLQEEEKDDAEIMTAKLAITATLVDFTGSDYVNIFINGEQVGAYGDMPTGAMQKSQNSLQEELARYERSAKAETASLTATLYFLDTTEEYLLPEIRSIAFESIDQVDMITQLVQEIINGPEDTYNHLPVIDSSLSQFKGVTIVQDEAGSNIAQLDFEKAPVVLTQGFRDGEQLTAAALTSAIVGFIPGIHGVQILVNGEAQNDGAIYTPDDFDSLLGNSIMLYFPNNTYTLLNSITRMVAQDEAGYPSELLSELMEGPSAADQKEIMPAFISGISMEDVNSVYLAGDIAVVDFNGSIQEKMREISQKNEFIMIYSIVNTLTNIENIKRVQFLVDGERVEYLGDGIVCVTDPLVKNPGIIRLT